MTSASWCSSSTFTPLVATASSWASADSAARGARDAVGEREAAFQRITGLSELMALEQRPALGQRRIDVVNSLAVREPDGPRRRRATRRPERER